MTVAILATITRWRNLAVVSGVALGASAITSICGVHIGSRAMAGTMSLCTANWRLLTVLAAPASLT